MRSSPLCRGPASPDTGGCDPWNSYQLVGKVEPERCFARSDVAPATGITIQNVAPEPFESTP
jgi:hypothetical protein